MSGGTSTERESSRSPLLTSAPAVAVCLAPSPLYYLPVCVCSSSLLIHHVADSMQDSTLGVFPPTGLWARVRVHTSSLLCAGRHSYIRTETSLSLSPLFPSSSRLISTLVYAPILSLSSASFSSFSSLSTPSLTSSPDMASSYSCNERATCESSQGQFRASSELVRVRVREIALSLTSTPLVSPHPSFLSGIVLWRLHSCVSRHDRITVNWSCYSGDRYRDTRS